MQHNANGEKTIKCKENKRTLKHLCATNMFNF